MALAEIVNIIPIFTLRFDVRMGLLLIVPSMAVGCTVGSLIFYYYRF